MNQRGKRSRCGWIIEGMFESHGKLLNNIVFNVLLEEWCTRSLYLKSTTAKRIMKDLDFVSKDEKQIIKQFRLFGTSD